MRGASTDSVSWPKEWKPALASEGCLFLNIWTQGVADGRKRPVMFYSHGGGFATGVVFAVTAVEALAADAAATAPPAREKTSGGSSGCV